MEARREIIDFVFFKYTAATKSMTEHVLLPARRNPMRLKTRDDYNTQLVKNSPPDLYPNSALL